MLNIVVPMAGHGSRFARAGYALPKPLVPVLGEPMVRRVVDNLRPQRPHRFVFLCLGAHLDDHRLGEALQAWAPGSITVPVREVTQGAACTVLLARAHIDRDDALVIANCDQLVDVDMEEHLRHLGPGDAGLIMTMAAEGPKWSYVRTAEDGAVLEVAEKRPISNQGTVGIYTFARGRDFVRAADDMVARDERTLGEFYVAPVYNVLVREGARVVTHNIGALWDGMYGLGTPEDLDTFHAMPLPPRWRGVAPR